MQYEYHCSIIQYTQNSTFYCNIYLQAAVGHSRFGICWIRSAVFADELVVGVDMILIEKVIVSVAVLDVCEIVQDRIRTCDTFVGLI